MSDLNLLSVCFNASRVALESTQTKIDKNVHGTTTKYDNAISITQFRCSLPDDTGLATPVIEVTSSRGQR